MAAIGIQSPIGFVICLDVVYYPQAIYGRGFYAAITSFHLSVPAGHNLVDAAVLLCRHYPLSPGARPQRPAHPACHYHPDAHAVSHPATPTAAPFAHAATHYHRRAYPQPDYAYLSRHARTIPNTHPTAVLSDQHNHPIAHNHRHRDAYPHGNGYGYGHADNNPGRQPHGYLTCLNNPDAFVDAAANHDKHAAAYRHAQPRTAHGNSAGCHRDAAADRDARPRPTNGNPAANGRRVTPQEVLLANQPVGKKQIRSH